MTSSLVIQPEVIDRARRRAAIESTRAAGVILPCWRQLADPSLIPGGAAGLSDPAAQQLAGQLKQFAEMFGGDPTAAAKVAHSA